MMKKTKHKKIIVAIVFAFLFLSISTAYVAAQTYTPLVPSAFPGVTVTPQTSLGTYLSIVFNFGIAIAVVLALIMLIWGGIMLMTTDSWEGKTEGRAKIEDALYGLGLALVSWLILYTINPCIVQFAPSSTNACQSTNTFLYPPKISTTTPNTNFTGTGGGGASGGKEASASY